MAEKGKAAGKTVLLKTPVSKRTSQGLRTPPLNKHKRSGWKKYRGQGRP
jgi:hypothetical protein